ncbi:hypothetical protein [Streptomyces cadmiisoli]|uniref:hypothetical protein n=1 Tax=Streptomyces cadmiisoli TaxID=2184053 RepID=UPI0036547971
MPVFPAHDGTRLAQHAAGEGPPLLRPPGGPARTSVCLGEPGDALCRPPRPGDAAPFAGTGADFLGVSGRAGG